MYGTAAKCGVATTIGGQRSEGKYLVVWKHEDGQWKLHLDAFNVAP
jgi:ketosteroid isomerase-like protein